MATMGTTEQIRTYLEMAELIEYDEASAKPSSPALQRASTLPPAQAIPAIEQELERARASNSRAQEFIAQLVMVRAKAGACQYEEAIADAKAAIAIAEAMADRAMSGAARHRLAWALLQKGDGKAALEAGLAALEDYGAVANADGQMSVRNTLARIYLYKNESEEAGNHIVNASAYFKAENNAPARLACMTTQCRLYFLEKSWMSAAHEAESTRKLVAEERMEQLVAQQVNLMVAELKQALEEYEAAEALARRAIDYFSEQQFQRQVAFGKMTVAMAESRRAFGDDALTTGENGLELYRQIGDIRGQAAAYKVLSDCYSKMSQYDIAIDKSLEAAQLYKQLKDQYGQAFCHRAASAAYIGAFKEASRSEMEEPSEEMLGKYVSEAVSAATQAQKVLQEIQDFSSLDYAAVLRCLAMAHGHVGEDSSLAIALRHSDEARAIYQRAGQKREVASCLTFSSEVLNHLGDVMGSINVAREARKIFEDMQDFQGAIYAQELVNAYQSGVPWGAGRNRGRPFSQYPFREGEIPEKDMGRFEAQWDISFGQPHALFERFTSRPLRQVEPKKAAKGRREPTQKQPWAFYTRMMPVEA